MRQHAKCLLSDLVMCQLLVLHHSRPPLSFPPPFCLLPFSFTSQGTGREGAIEESGQMKEGITDNLLPKGTASVLLMVGLVLPRREYFGYYWQQLSVTYKFRSNLALNIRWTTLGENSACDWSFEIGGWTTCAFGLILQSSSENKLANGSLSLILIYDLISDPCTVLCLKSDCTHANSNKDRIWGYTILGMYTG